MASFLQIYNQIEYQLKDAIFKLTEYRTELQQYKEKNRLLNKALVEKEKEKNEWKEKYFILSQNMTREIQNNTNTENIKHEIKEIVREIDQCLDQIQGK